MIQTRIYELGEKEWTITRQDLTKRIFGKSLIPEEWTQVKLVLTKVEPGGEFSLHKDSYHHVFSQYCILHFFAGIPKYL